MQEDTTIPWRISNKYYDADVHFSIEPLSSNDENESSTAPDDADSPPAVIYAFETGSVSNISLLTLVQQSSFS